VTGAGLIVRRGAVPARGLDGLRAVGVLMGTTTEAMIRRFAADRGTRLTVVPVESHDVAIGALRSGQIDAYVADRDLLAEMLAARGNPADILIADSFLSVEPYALAMRRGEDRLRLIADRTIAGLYRSGEILEVFRRWMSTPEPGAIVRALYAIQALEE
jgi:polar amino acid transport system substrate-binding protein/glutamate/aspartate transport system substrate-binding protein